MRGSAGTLLQSLNQIVFVKDDSSGLYTSSKTQDKNLSVLKAVRISLLD